MRVWLWSRPGPTAYFHKELLFVTVYAPSIWPYVAEQLGEIATGNGASLIRPLGANIELNVTKAASAQFVFNQVVCSDAPELSTEAVESATEKLQNEIIRMYEEDGNKYFATGVLSACHAWPVRAPKRFTGPFNHSLSNPILVIGNTVRTERFILPVFELIKQRRPMCAAFNPC